MKRWLLSLVSAETLETIGLWLIIVGLIGEAGLVFSWFETQAHFEKSLTFVFTLAIAFGVWLEHVGAADISSEKDARIAEANARALEAQLELEKLRAPRHLSREQWAAVIDKIRPFGVQQFDLASNGADPESNRMGNALLFNLSNGAGWRPVSWQSRYGMPVTRWSISNFFPDWGVNNMVIGVEIEVHSPEYEKLGPAAEALAKALADAGIQARATRRGSHSANTDTIHILVGTKM